MLLLLVKRTVFQLMYFFDRFNRTLWLYILDMGSWYPAMIVAIPKSYRFWVRHKIYSWPFYSRISIDVHTARKRNNVRKSNESIIVTQREEWTANSHTISIWIFYVIKICQKKTTQLVNGDAHQPQIKTHENLKVNSETLYQKTTDLINSWCLNG